MAQKMKKPFYSDDEKILRVWDIEDIKDLMSRRGFYIANDMRREELNDLWVTTPKYQETASLGSNWGYYVGMDEISNYYVVKHAAERQKLLDAYCAAHPDVENRRENLGYGCMSFHPASTPLVVLSGDGYTARGLWYVIGQESTWRPGGPASCRWFNDKLAADFVKEKGQWRIWHLVIANDINVEAGKNLNEMPTIPAPGTNPAEVEFTSSMPTIRMLTHNNAMNWSDNYPPIPRPYFHFDDENSYGTEGHPNYEGEQEKRP
jgi:hypothetical protein